MYKVGHQFKTSVQISDNQLGVRVLPGVRTRLFRGMQKIE